MLFFCNLFPVKTVICSGILRYESVEKSIRKKTNNIKTNNPVLKEVHAPGKVTAEKY